MDPWTNTLGHNQLYNLINSEDDAFSLVLSIANKHLLELASISKAQSVHLHWNCKIQIHQIFLYFLEECLVFLKDSSTTDIPTKVQHCSSNTSDDNFSQVFKKVGLQHCQSKLHFKHSSARISKSRKITLEK